MIKPQQAIELCGIDSDIVVSAVSVVCGDKVIGSAKVTVGSVVSKKRKEIPVRVVIVGPMIVNARLARGNRADRFAGLWKAASCAGRCFRRAASTRYPELPDR